MLSRKQIEDKVIEVVTETLALSSPAQLSDSFRDDLEADSIDIVTMMVSLQDEMGESFDVNDMEGKDTVLSVVDFLVEELTKETKST